MRQAATEAANQISNQSMTGRENGASSSSSSGDIPEKTRLEKLEASESGSLGEQYWDKEDGIFGWDAATYRWQCRSIYDPLPPPPKAVQQEFSSKGVSSNIATGVAPAATASDAAVGEQRDGDAASGASLIWLKKESPPEEEEGHGTDTVPGPASSDASAFAGEHAAVAVVTAATFGKSPSSSISSSSSDAAAAVAATATVVVKEYAREERTREAAVGRSSASLQLPEPTSVDEMITGAAVDPTVGDTAVDLVVNGEHSGGGGGNFYDPAHAGGKVKEAGDDGDSSVAPAVVGEFLADKASEDADRSTPSPSASENDVVASSANNGDDGETSKDPTHSAYDSD